MALFKFEFPVPILPDHLLLPVLEYLRVGVVLAREHVDRPTLVGDAGVVEEGLWWEKISLLLIWDILTLKKSMRNSKSSEKK